MNPAGFGQQQQQQLPSTFNTQPLNPAAYNPPPQPTSVNQQVGAVEKPQPVEKVPIPDEHAIIQSIFDDLRNKCSCAANNPVIWIC